MKSDEKLFRMVEKIGFFDRYAALCSKFNVDRPMGFVNAKRMVLRSKHGLQMKKLSGPGSALVISDMPIGCEFIVVIKSGALIEVNFKVGQYGSGLHILYNDGIDFFRPGSERYYPRPVAMNEDEAVEIVEVLKELFLDIAGALYGDQENGCDVQ